MFQQFSGIRIHSLSSCIPPNAVPNTYFDLLSPKELRVFEKTVGIKTRRWAAENVTAADLGFEAAKNLLLQQNCKEEIAVVLFVSQTPDFKIPFTSNILQSRLGLSKRCLCIDINAGCTGFVQGLSTAFSFAQTLQYDQKVLLIIGETLSKILSHKDRSTSMLFGDGASAILLSKDKAEKKNSYFSFYSDGSKSDAIKIPDGGNRNPVTSQSITDSIYEDGSVRNNTQLSMQGTEVFDFTLKEIAKSVIEFTQETSISLCKIDQFLFHQSNHFIIKQITNQLAIDSKKVQVNIDSFGNTSGVSIPLLITTNLKQPKSKELVLCSGYGSGLNWGNCLIDLSNTNILPLIIYNL